MFFVDPGSPANQETGFLTIEAAGACCHPCPCGDQGLLGRARCWISASALALGRENGCFLPDPGCQVSSLVGDWDPVQRRGQVSGQS